MVTVPIVVKIQKLRFMQYLAMIYTVPCYAVPRHGSTVYYSKHMLSMRRKRGICGNYRFTEIFGIGLPSA